MFVPNIIDDSVDSAPNDLPNLRFQTITRIEVTNAIEFYIPMSDPVGTHFPQEHVLPDSLVKRTIEE